MIGDTQASTKSWQHLSRRERERLARRHLILKAARQVFAEKGYADATLEEIAHRAEFGKGTLYNYFPAGKEEILFAIFDELYESLHQLIGETFHPELVRKQDFREVFTAFLTALLSFFVDRKDSFMIMMKEGHRMVFNEEPGKAVYFQRQARLIIEALAPAIDAAKAWGVLRDFPTEAVAHLIMGNAKGYHMHQCMAECYRDRAPQGREALVHSPEESAAFLSTLLLDGLLPIHHDPSPYPCKPSTA